ncbi:MAG TPA: transglycosylase domain-containing protein [Kofleriaceae bacterium]|nr:transglycosylase domain-containing protein [Kofleriaceae bacterium]
MRFFGGTRIAPKRRWMIPAIAAGGVCVVLAILLLVVYPRVGASKVRDKVTAKLGTKLGREIRIGDVDVSLGHAVIRNLEIRGPNDGELPLVHVDRIDVNFDALASLVGSIKVGDAIVDGVTVSVRRNADGRDNISDVIERVRAPKQGGGESSGSTPTSIKLVHARLLANDIQAGATMVINDGEATWKPGELLAQASKITATTIGAPRAGAARVTVRKVDGQPPSIAVEGGEISLWETFSLTGIGGNVTADPAHPGQYTLEFAGGYGGVPGNLWTAKGALDPTAKVGSVDLVAAKFQLDRLAPILARTPVVDYNSTSVDTKIRLDLDHDSLKFAGELHLHGLNVGHPMIADKEVHDLDLSAKVAGVFDRAAGRLALEQGDFVARDLPFSVTGFIAKPRTTPDTIVQPDPTKPAGKQVETVAQRGPGGIQLLDLRLVIPPIDCQRVLAAIPSEMAPYLAGYKLRGMFDADINLDIDWADLDATKLGGHVGLKHCKVVDEPADSPKRLKEEFEHYVEVEKGKWHSFIVGPTNEDFVPFDQISPYLVKSIMSTEDSAFYYHKGFITTEFRTALVNDLKAGRFRYGASSITMQMVKNVLLYREKTLARKLQELFLTWHVENTLTKDRILEIYFNVIEYGPDLYGIGPAAKHFFGKPAKDLNPVEAAFFSTILPSPKERYKQYCAGTLTKWTDDKIRRILNIMLKRDRLTQQEYDQAMATPLVFVKNGDETEEQCLKRVKQAIKNARSTNPLKK